MGHITRTASRETAVDFSYPYFITRMGFYSRKPSPVPRVLAILWPYSTFVWISLAVSVPLFSMVLWIFSKIDKDGFTLNFNFGTALLQVSQMLVMQGVKVQGVTGLLSFFRFRSNLLEILTNNSRK